MGMGPLIVKSDHISSVRRMLGERWDMERIGSGCYAAVVDCLGSLECDECGISVCPGCYGRNYADDPETVPMFVLSMWRGERNRCLPCAVKGDPEMARMGRKALAFGAGVSPRLRELEDRLRPDRKADSAVNPPLISRTNPAILE